MIECPLMVALPFVLLAVWEARQALRGKGEARNEFVSGLAGKGK